MAAHFAVNNSAMFHATKAVLNHMREGRAITNTATIVSTGQSRLRDYDPAEGAIQNFTAGKRRC